MRYDYSPFLKSFDDIAIDDLATLKSVAEGWHVEYKRQLPNAGAVAKSISAFANTYGGWLFYGIAEKSKEEAVAGAYPGIDRTEADAALQSIRQSVANHVQPSPFFRAKALFGPSDGLNLAEDRCIIVVHVPWGADAPIVHKDGRIYRRVSDGSEPKPESDRFVLDQLFSRATRVTDRHAEWVGRELELSEDEKRYPYVRIFLIADFWGDHPEMPIVPLQKVREIMKDSGEGFSLGFEAIQRTAGGIVCRQMGNPDPHTLTLTWTVHNNFRSEVILPLSKFRRDSLDDLQELFEGYEHIDRFIEICRGQRYHLPTVIDLNIVLLALFAFGRKQRALAKEFGWTGPIMAKVQLNGLWRTIPFLDAEEVLDDFEEHGIPLNLRDEILLYRGKERSTYIELPAPIHNADEVLPYLPFGVTLFLHIAQALGVSGSQSLEGNDNTTFAETIVKLLGAGDRALAVQKMRNANGY